MRMATALPHLIGWLQNCFLNISPLAKFLLNAVVPLVGRSRPLAFGRLFSVWLASVPGRLFPSMRRAHIPPLFCTASPTVQHASLPILPRFASCDESYLIFGLRLQIMLVQLWLTAAVQLAWVACRVRAQGADAKIRAVSQPFHSVFVCSVRPSDRVTLRMLVACRSCVLRRGCAVCAFPRVQLCYLPPRSTRWIVQGPIKSLTLLTFAPLCLNVQRTTVVDGYLRSTLALALYAHMVTNINSIHVFGDAPSSS